MNIKKKNTTQFYLYLLYKTYISALFSMKIIKSGLLFILVTIGFAAFPCTKPNEITIEEYNRMDFVFIGNAIAVDETPFFIDMPDSYIKVTFAIEKVYKGDPTLKTISIYTPFLPTLCRLDMKANQKWVIFASNTESKFVTTKESSSILYDSINDKSLKLLSEISTFRNGYFIGKYSNGKTAGKGFFENGKPEGLWKYYDNKGFLSYGGYYKSGIKDSTWLFYWELNRQFTKTVNTFKNGVPEGKQLEYFITDTLGKVFYYKNGKLNGNYFEFYPSGKLKYKGNYKDNLKIGIWTYFNEQNKILTKDTIPWTGSFRGRDSLGTVIAEGSYKNGLQTGEWVYMDSDGHVIEKINYKDGVVDGKRTEWFNNSQKASDGYYKMGAKNSIFMTWYLNGKIKSEMKYIMDTVQYSKIWNEDGILILKETFKNGLYETRVTWDDNGVVLAEEEYQAGDPSGTWQQYFNGKIHWKRKIINNEIGTDTWYYENGKKKEEGDFNYNTGKKIGKWKSWNEKGKLVEVKEFSQE
jgi:antitoxin component YwqK of YwqJK toxin-antitoxin module